ncbi:Putative permease [Idiomarina sp. A28L]|uniref:AI-2E family transporter n=1 Tax=Idiomarina sp. A28L TaxID=1036674 RepID=UPI0002138C50|nr:AI-2E family transporter [Idiomarina sp. A28L]EGN74373.1 Putative permease [Idiomarina sp. A28L]
MTDHNQGLLTSSRFFLVAAAIMVILASIKAASVIVVPFLLALFIAIIFQPVIFWFRKKGLPPILAISAIFVIILVLGSGFAGLVLNSVNEFTTNMPQYRGKLTEQFQSLVEIAARFNLHLDAQVLQSHLDPSRLLSMSVNLLSGLGNMMTNIFIILLIVVFMLSEAALMPKKIALAFPSPEKKLLQMSHLLLAINKYLALKTLISFITGALVGVGLWLMGVDHFILWAVIAFLFNYIPNIGSIIAAIPAILMALIQFNPAMAGFVALLFLAVNVVMGNFVEPRMMGRGLGLSTLVVFLSLIFWGWLLGPVGMLLSVPLTMGVKIGFNESPSTRWLAILLSGDEVRHLDEEDVEPRVETQKSDTKKAPKRASKGA